MNEVDPALLLSDIRLPHNLEDQERSLTFPKTSPGKLCSTFYLTPSDCLKVDLLLLLLLGHFSHVRLCATP